MLVTPSRQWSLPLHQWFSSFQRVLADILNKHDHVECRRSLRLLRDERFQTHLGHKFFHDQT